MKKTSEILSGIPSFSALSESQLEEIEQIVDRGFIKVKKSDIRILDHTGLEELAVHGKIIE